MSSYLEFETGVPVCFTYLRNEAKLPPGVVPPPIYAQEVEPAGQFFLVAEVGADAKSLVPGWVSGRVMVKSPLILPFGEGYGSVRNWKSALSEEYQGLVGRALTRAIVKDGYDSIMTVGTYKDVRSLSECVYLGAGKGQVSLANNVTSRSVEMATLLRLCSCKEAQDSRYAAMIRAHIDMILAQPSLSDIRSAVELTEGGCEVIRQLLQSMSSGESLLLGSEITASHSPQVNI